MIRHIYQYAGCFRFQNSRRIRSGVDGGIGMSDLSSDLELRKSIAKSGE